MAGGAELGSGYIKLTVQADGSTLDSVTNKFKDMDKVAQTTMSNLKTNFDQTYKSLSDNQQRALDKWRGDMGKYKSEYDDLLKLQRKWSDDMKSGLFSSDQLQKEEQQLKNFRVQAQQTYQQMAQDKQAFFRSLADSTTGVATGSAWQNFKAGFSNALGGMKSESATTGQLIAHNMMVPIQRAGDGIANVFRLAFDKIKGFATVAMYGVAGIVTASLTGAIYKGVQQLSDVEQLRTKMKFLGQDMMQFNTMIRDMEGLEKSTGLDMVDLANAASSFLQQGVKSGTDLNRVMQDAADISAATGQSVQETSMQMLRFMSGNTQRMQFQIQAMANKQIPIMKWMADEFADGNQKAMAKMLSKGEVTWAMYQQVVQKHLHGISQTMGNTFKGAIFRIKDSLEDLGAAIMRPFFGPMTAGMNQISTWIDKLTEKVKANQPAIVHAAGVIAQALINAGKGVMELFASLGDALSHVLAAAADIASKIPGQTELAKSLAGAAQTIENNVTHPLRLAVVEANNLNEKTKGFFDELERSSVLSSAFNDSISNATNEGVFLKDPTEAVRANLEQLKITLETMPDGTFKLIPLTPDAAKLVDDYQRRLGLKPLYLDMEARVTKVDWMGRQKFSWASGDLSKATAQQQVGPPQDFSSAGGGWTPMQAASLLWPFSPAGALAQSGALLPWLKGNATGQYPTEATIQQSVAPYGLVQWAEPSTGGEAFIPLGAANRERSLDIWAQTGRMLGVFDEGGFNGGNFNPGMAIDTSNASVWTASDHARAKLLRMMGVRDYRRYGGSYTPPRMGNPYTPMGNPNYPPMDNPYGRTYGGVVAEDLPGLFGFAGGGWLGGKGGGWAGGSSGGAGGYGGVGGIRLWAGQLQRLIKAMFPAIREIGGYRPHDPYPDHPSGEAIDVMIPAWNTKAGVMLGNRIKDFTMANARRLHVDYDIWRQAMWYPGRAPQPMANRGSPTQNHYDHVHIRVKRGGGGPDTGSMLPGGGLGGYIMGSPFGGMGMRISGQYVPIGYPLLPGGRWTTSYRAFAGGGFRWPWKRDGDNQIGPFPVPPVVAGAAKPRGGLGTAGKAPGTGTGTGGGGFRPPYQHHSEPPGPGWQDPGTGAVTLPGGGSVMPDDGSSDSSSDTGADSPYYTPGDAYVPTYFDTQDFLTDPQITPAEAKKLRNASEKIENLNGRLNIANQQLAELKANPKTKPSQIIAKEQEIARLTNDRDNAVDDFNRLQQEVLVAKPGKGGRGRGLDGSGINPALADNPYYKLMMAEQMKQEAYAGIMPDPGALADIGIGGLKESFLPPGFSDPQTWGVTQAASGLLNFLGGIMPDPISGGLLSMGGAALGGSGSGMASAIRGMIPKPFGSLEIGSPDEAPGIPGYDQSGVPVPGRRLPIGQVPGMPRGDAAANSAGNVYNDNRIQVTGGNDGLASKARDNMTAQQAPIARRNIGKYARGST